MKIEIKTLETGYECVHMAGDLDFNTSPMTRKELGQLIGKYVENVYSIGENKLRIRIGGVDVICEPGKRMHVTKYIEQSEEISPSVYVNTGKQTC